MLLPEFILRALSVEPHSAAGLTHKAYPPGTELDRLFKEFPDLRSRVRDREVLDYGCGTGYQAVAMVTQLGASGVLGVEPHVERRACAQQLAEHSGLGDRVRFRPGVDDDLLGRFDVVISQNAMEHFRDPEYALNQMRDCLRPKGVALITFGPPWFAPYGAHMHFFTRVPWVNLLFSEQAVMRTRSRYRADGIMRYEDLAEGLNRMTVGRFERLLAASGFRVLERRYKVIRNIALVGKTPGLRELFVNHITVVLAAEQ